MAAAEAAPFAKVGGLADVVGSLPLALAKSDCDVRVFIPLYGTIDREKFRLKKLLADVNIDSAGSKEKVNVWQAKLKDSKVIFYFLECRHFSKNIIYKPEGENQSGEYLFFSVAVVAVLPILKFQPDIVHCHDCHTAMIPDLLKRSGDAFFKNTKSVFTIHNIKYQGSNSPLILNIADLNVDSLDSLKIDAQDGEINFMVQGILNADIVTTVSKTYAKEIATADYGFGLEKVIKNRKKIYGVVNGIDVKLFNPATDKLIFKKYSAKTLKNKTENKLALQAKIGFEQTKEVPLISMVTRVGWQKGFDLFTDELFKLPCQFVILGTGEKIYENKLLDLAKKYPNKLKYKNYFDLKLAQQIYAGSDIFLMPSKFEPCGLGQMIAMRYGTIPVVRATGGLADTVNNKVGFKFKEFSPEEMIKTIKKVLVLYKNKDKWLTMQKNCMSSDFSWSKSAKDYINLYITK